MNPKVKEEVAAYINSFRADLRDPEKPFCLLARLKIKEGSEAKCEAAFAKMLSFTRMEKGFVAFDLNREAKDSTRFVVYEKWNNLRDLEEHLLTPYTTSLRHDVESMLAEIPEFLVLNPAAD